MSNAKGLPLPRTGLTFTKRPPGYYTRDMYWVYEFIRRLATPFNKWPAFKAGIIDAQGNIKIHVKDLTPQQQKAWSYLDELSVGIKKLINRVPGIQPKLKTIVGTMLLMKERKNPSHPSETELSEQFVKILNTLQEDGVAVNSAGAGNIAGIGIGPQGQPPIKMALFRRLKRRGVQNVRSK